METNRALWQNAATGFHRKRIGWLNKPRKPLPQLLALVTTIILWIIGQTLIAVWFTLRHMLRAMNKTGDTRLASLYTALLVAPLTLIAIRSIGWTSVDKVIDSLPVFSSLPDKSVDSYIDRWSETAINQMHEYGVPASITLAQAINESDHGTSPLANEGRNHFGIKCHSDWKGETMRLNDDKPNECFRKYRNDEESFADYARFLRKHPRYASLFTLNRTDYRGWAYGLKAKGYATDKQYPKKLINLIEKYQLHRFDRM